MSRSDTQGPAVTEFIETFCRLSKGEWGGQEIVLRPWQKALIDDLFALRPDGRRKHRTGYIGMARKNGKSTLCAALALYGLIADGEPGAEVYCLDENTRVLCGDLTWRPIGELKAGDGLLAFDENPNGSHYRKLRSAQVVSTARIRQQTFRVTFMDGRQVIASSTHKWLGRRHNVSNAITWIETRELIPGMRIRDIGRPWCTDETRDGGYLAGILDGEGYVVGGQGGNYRRGSVVGIAQLPGVVLNKTKALLNERGFTFTERPQASGSGVVELTFRGLHNCLCLVGSVQAHRLVGKATRWLEGQTPNRVSEQRVVSIEPLGEREVVALGTSTGTLFAEGLFSHNSCAGDKKQAEIVFSEAKQMVLMDPDLSELVRVQRYHLEVPSTGAVYRVLSADAKLQQGLNPSFVVFDEVHVQPTGDLWTAMTLGSGTRRQPLIIGITTAGYDEQSIAYRLYDYGKKVNSGQTKDETFFFRWWEPSRPDCDWQDPEVWAEANPAYGDFLKAEDFETTARTTPENEFRRFRCNQWVKSADAWLPFGAWAACEDKSLDLDPALPLRVGIDVSLRNDSTAVVCAQKQGERIVLRSRIWQNPFPEEDSRFKSWELNIFEVEKHLRELRERFPKAACEIDDVPMPGPEFSYDPAYFDRSAQILRGEGLSMVEYKQHDSLMIPASQRFFQLIVERRIAHDGDPTLTEQIGNAVADQKPRGWRLTKQKGHHRRKIDGAVAAAIAAHRALEPIPVVRVSRYESEGLRML